jgi:membrane protein
MKLLNQLNYPKNKILFSLFKFFLMFVFVGLCANVLFYLYQEHHIRFSFTMLSSYIHINYDHLYFNLIGFFYSFALIVSSQYIWISYKQKNNILYKSLIVSYYKLLCIFPIVVLIPVALNNGVGLSGFVTALLSYSALFFIYIIFFVLINFIKGKTVNKMQLLVIGLAMVIVYLLRYSFLSHLIVEPYIYFKAAFYSEHYLNLTHSSLYEHINWLLDFQKYLRNEKFESICHDLFNMHVCIFPYDKQSNSTTNYLAHIIGTILGFVAFITNIFIHYQNKNRKYYVNIKSIIKNSYIITICHICSVYFCLMIYIWQLYR